MLRTGGYHSGRLVEGLAGTGSAVLSSLQSLCISDPRRHTYQDIDPQWTRRVEQTATRVEEREHVGCGRLHELQHRVQQPLHAVSAATLRRLQYGQRPEDVGA